MHEISILGQVDTIFEFKVSSNKFIGFFQISIMSTYRMRAIISRGLYIFYPISKDHFFVFKEVFSENFVLIRDSTISSPYVWLVFKSGLWWRAYGI